jgi:hypothetical protein
MQKIMPPIKLSSLLLLLKFITNDRNNNASQAFLPFVPNDTIFSEKNNSQDL